MLGFRIIRASRTFAGLRTSVKYDENGKWFLRSTLKIERELDKEGELCMPDPIINPIVIPRRFYCLPVGENPPAPNLSSGRAKVILPMRDEDADADEE